jgi:hypothetical protein
VKASEADDDETEWAAMGPPLYYVPFGASTQRRSGRPEGEGRHAHSGGQSLSRQHAAAHFFVSGSQRRELQSTSPEQVVPSEVPLSSLSKHHFVSELLARKVPYAQTPKFGPSVPHELALQHGGLHLSGKPEQLSFLHFGTAPEQLFPISVVAPVPGGAHAHVSCEGGGTATLFTRQVVPGEQSASEQQLSRQRPLSQRPERHSVPPSQTSPGVLGPVALRMATAADTQ